MTTRSQVLFTAVARTGATLLAGLTAILIAQLLGAGALGLFGLLRATPAVILLLTELGIASATSYLINQRGISAQDVLSMSLGVALLVGSLDAIIWYASSSLIGEHLLTGIPTLWVALAGLTIPALAIESVITQVLRAKQHFKAANAIRWGLELGILAFFALLASFGSIEPWMLIPSLLCAHLAIILYGGLQLTIRKLRLRPRFSWALLAEAAHFGIRSQIGNTLNMLNYRMDHLILGLLTDLRTVGIYVVASKAAEFFRVVTVALTFVLEPQLARAKRSDALSRAKRLLLPTFSANLLIISIAWIVGPIMIPILFDDWSLTAIFPYHILLAGLAARGTNGVLVALNAGQGKPELTTYAVAVGFVLTVILDIILIPKWQVVGAAIASSIAQVAIALGLLLSFYYLNMKSHGPKH
jgi:O-antigen/teichoic acid export membrane protein